MINGLREKEIAKLRKSPATTNFQDIKSMIYLIEKVVSAVLIPEFTEAV